MEKTISIIGLGKLGSSMVAAYASRGFNIIGVDINEAFVDAINQVRPPVAETNLAKYLSENKDRISATTDYAKAVANSYITFIIVPTPSKENGDFSTEYAVNAAKEIGKALKEKEDFHVVVLTSTVTPGSTQRDIQSVLEEYSGKKCGVDFGLCYNPEFIALGSVIENLLNPDFTLIGQSDERSGNILESMYEVTCPGKPVKRMNIVNAEIVKIALNTYVTTKISYANMLSELCEKIPGGNVHEVTDALGMDTRIGRKYLKGALGYGGPCFPRDNRAFMHTARALGVELPLAAATDYINNKQALRVADRVLSALPSQGTVGILGLSYKPNTNIVEESQALEICKLLSDRGITVFAYDPMGMENAKKHLGERVTFASSAKECVDASDVIVIATPWDEFKNVQLFISNKKTTIIDCWNLLNIGAIRYVTMGKHE